MLRNSAPARFASLLNARVIVAALARIASLPTNAMTVAPLYVPILAAAARLVA